MDKCFSDVIVDTLTNDGGELFKPLDPEQRQLLAEVLDTIKNLEEYEGQVDCTQLHDWLTETVQSMVRKDGGVFVAKMALPVRSNGYSLRWLEQAWDAAFGSAELKWRPLI